MLLSLVQQVGSLPLWVGTFALYWHAYSFGHYLLVKHKRYAALSAEKQVYVVSNLLKGVMLGMFTAVLADVVLDLVVFHRWNGPKMRMLAPFYVNLDVVSLFKVSKMKRSTFAHHVAVGLFGIVVELNPARPGTLSGQICAYAVFSMLAYLVNMVLALRYVVSLENGPFIERVARWTGVLYMTVCAVHWTFQLYFAYIYRLWYLPALLYVFVFDDIDLMRWLFTYRAPRVSQAAAGSAAGE